MGLFSSKQLKDIDAAHNAHRDARRAVADAKDAGKSAAEIRRLEQKSIEAARVYNRTASAR